MNRRKAEENCFTNMRFKSLTNPVSNQTKTIITFLLLNIQIYKHEYYF